MTAAKPNGHHNGSVNGTTASHTGKNNEVKSNVMNGSNGYSNLTTLVPPPLIAIVGMGMRIPGGVNDSESLWDLLINKRDAQGEIPSHRYNSDGFYSPHPKPGTVVTNKGYFLKDTNLAEMDAGFFSMSKAEVEKLDPQQRLMLEVVWETFENAGERNWRGKDVGCYVGSFAEDWSDLRAKDTQDFGVYRLTGKGDFLLGNRISYEYDLKGPRYVQILIHEYTC
jgi:acyl transferase domain-containing protein